jgi:hypothetical protein
VSSASSVVEVVAKMKIAWNHRLAAIQGRLQDYQRSATITARMGGAVLQLEILCRELSFWYARNAVVAEDQRCFKVGAGAVPIPVL